MKPATAAITIDRPPADVRRLLDDITAHERFLDHFLTDWELISASSRGVGSAVRLKAKGAGRHDTVEVRVLEADQHRIVEESRGGKGMRRRARGVYEVAGEGDGTRLTFRLDLLDPNLADRASWPLARRLMARGTQRGLRRLKMQMEGSVDIAAQAAAASSR